MALIIAENSIVINAPAAECFEKFNNPEYMVEWFTTSIAIRNFTPPLAIGQTYEVAAQFMGQEIVQAYEVLEIDAPNRFVFRTKGIFTGEVRHTCESVDGGTKVTIHAEFEPSGFVAKMPAALVKPPINMQMRGDLKKFKAYMET